MGKLKILLMYVDSMISMPIILRAESLHIIKWWVAVSFTTNYDCQGHTGASMSLDKGSIIEIPRKEKINTTISTKSELVGADKPSPSMMWTRYFVEAQGLTVEGYFMYQDNLITMLLKRNGKKLSSKITSK
jgi:hypothetical protein